MNKVIKRICRLVGSIFTFEEISGNNTLESAFNNNMVKTNYYLRNTSNYYLKLDESKKLNNFDELTTYKKSILSSFKKLCIECGAMQNNEEQFDIEKVLFKLDEFLGFYIDFPDIFDKDEFNWLPYLNYNSDLVLHNITSLDSVNKHWEEYGICEKRVINGSVGLLTSRGVISQSYLNSLTYILKIKNMIGANFKNSTIHDINGGIGINSYYLRKMGFRNIVLVNKREQCLLSSYYLLSLFNEDDVTLFSENTDNSILIVPSYKYVELSSGIKYFIHCDGENANVVNASEFDSHNFDKKFILISS